MIELGALERVNVRTAWGHEAANFTPWLAENLQLLGGVLQMELSLEATEQAIGNFRADILARDAASNQLVLIENQLERTDHEHLGQIITYASGVRANTIVWIAETFTNEHRSAIDWLNEVTNEQFQAFGIEIELWKIGGSAPAPKFNIVANPNAWARKAARLVSIKDQIRSLLAEEPKISARAIAARVGCSPTTASTWKKAIEQELSIVPRLHVVNE